jgi:hypothetical protein
MLVMVARLLPMHEWRGYKSDVVGLHARDQSRVTDSLVSLYVTLGESCGEGFARRQMTMIVSDDYGK